MKIKEDLIKAFTAFVEAYGEKQEVSEVYKSTEINEELQEATWVVLAPEEYDHHNDIYSEEEIRKACDNYNTHCMKANLHHMFMATDEDVVVKDSWVTDEDLTFGDVTIKKGTWLQTWKIHNKDIWKGVKDGFYGGLSIQGKAYVEELE